MNPFPSIQFTGQLRPSQADVVAIARKKLAGGKRHLHIVAPPGSGKTVLGLYLWAECVRRPALVLSPNSAIQAQWVARTDLFKTDVPQNILASTQARSPALLTSLTYQSVTLPARGDTDLDAAAIVLWEEKLIESQQAKDPVEASVWIEDLRRHNPEYFEQRLSGYRKQVRDATAIQGGSLGLLHQSSRETLQRLKQHGIGLIILDECHHLLGHWGRVLADAHDLLDQPIVVGLTATPPDRDGKRPEDVERYDEFFGEVDYEVPVPAVVKDGFLAPYQDLAYFVRPQRDELSFIAQADEQFHAIVADLCQPKAVDGGKSDGNTSDNVSQEESAEQRADSASHESRQPVTSPRYEMEKLRLTGEPLSDWLIEVLAERRLPTGKMRDWVSFERRDPVFAQAARVFLVRRGHALPLKTPAPILLAPSDEDSEMETLVPVLDRYVRHHLRRSHDSADRKLAETIIRRLRTLGVQITETGSQACASPVGRVMAYSRAKTLALVPILRREHAVLGDGLRAVVVADYEKTSAVTAEVEHLLDAEAGGAIAAFRQLIRDPETDLLDPILVTGSSVLVDDDLAERFDLAAKAYLSKHGYDVDLSFGEEAGFHVINGRGGDWCPRVYVAMITELFQQGLTRCLVGTRGLLGEGWDANRVNVLIDLTTVTTSMTVNQLRGRSIRLDPTVPEKVANNWDVVCIAPEFTKGLDDYGRFIAKHKTLYGVTDDGAIEKGVGHVHAAFTELKPEGLEGSTSILNDEMLSRASARQRARQLWRIGEPYSQDPIRAVEAEAVSGGGGFPPFNASREPWSNSSLALAIGEAVLDALVEARLVRPRDVHVGERAGGYVRVFLKQATDEENILFTRSLQEVLGPLDRPRYVIPRYVDRYRDTWLSTILPTIIGRYFQRRQRHRCMLHAVPTVLGKNKDLVAVFEKHWNGRVSPGEALYAHRGTGKDLLDEAKREGLVPTGRLHEKEIFM